METKSCYKLILGGIERISVRVQRLLLLLKVEELEPMNERGIVVKWEQQDG